MRRTRADYGESVEATRVILSLVYGAILAAAVVGAVLTSRAEDWAPLSLLGLLFVLAAGSELLGFEIRGPAALRLVPRRSCSRWRCSARRRPSRWRVACALRRRARRRARSIDRMLVNIATYATFPLVGGIAIACLVGDFDPRYGDPLWFAAVVLGTFLATNTLNFAMVAAAVALRLRHPGPRHAARRSSPRCRRSSRPALLTASVAFTYGHLGHGLGRPGRRRALRLPLHPAHERPGAGARRGTDASARASSPRCRWACSRRCCRRSRCATR